MSLSLKRTLDRGIRLSPLSSLIGTNHGMSHGYPSSYGSIRDQSRLQSRDNRCRWRFSHWLAQTWS
ncbi:Uncharacterised protein [Vibrio cholerae]|nr:Uncharacterised protein [Vibrio cholerae]